MSMPSGEGSITQQLWQLARSGDQAAYDRLFARHADRALLFIHARLGPVLRQKIDAEDVLQDAYLHAHRSFEQFIYTDEGSFLRWLCRIIEHRLSDWHDHFTAQKRQAVPVPHSDPTGPATALDRAEHRVKVAKALESLSEDHRQVLLFRYFEGLNSEEIGQRMGRSAGAIRKLTARALEELGKAL